MKSLGRDESLSLAAVQESVDELRDKFDLFAADPMKLRRKLEGNPYWLIETMWQIRKEVGVVTRAHASPLRSMADVNKIIGLTLDLEYLEDRAREFAGLLPDLVNPALAVDFEEFLTLLAAAEGSVRLYEMVVYMGLWSVHIDSDRLTHSNIRAEVQSYLERFEKAEVFTKSVRLLAAAIKLRVQFELLLNQLDVIQESEIRAEKKKELQVAERAKLDRFTVAHQAVQAECENLKQWLCGPATEDYLNEIYKHVLPVRQAMSELGLAVGALQHLPNYNTFMATYQADSGLSSFMIRAADKAAERYERSATWYGRLANWLDDVLSSKGSP